MSDLNLKDILIANGFTFKKKLGQNFITDRNLLSDIVQKAGVTKDSVVVEIGCGAGTLTRELCKSAKYVYAYEIDERLKPVLSMTLAGVENCEVVFRDFLKLRMDVFEKEMPPYVVVANLPYYITTPLIMQFVEYSQKCASVCVMIQEEVARRLTAEPGTAEYGAITAQIALRAKCSIVKSVKREMFYPRPNVDSSLVRIDFMESPLGVKDPAVYKKCVKAGFANRRKTLENNLVQSFGLTREIAKDIIADCGFAADIRGERLSPGDFCSLADRLCEIKQ
ncbi:MAG: 16S rRNA (adenine(1518)-N(6)/adenine(1519)-N(6))-dimethyltransferase RsmA [Clostridia bacterium]|nr:16S rRNA (adenine(1518)-N(6)/adenine(1519)-N(6))-dimethyltransferase RsmA [Clostridia bacterium]